MNDSRNTPAGYALLRERHRLTVPPARHESSIRSDSGDRRLSRDGFRIAESFSKQYAPAADDFDQLVFALKYDGVDLAILKQVFQVIDRRELARRITAQPTSLYGHRLFFFFELLTGERLPIHDVKGVRYRPALDAEEYYVAEGTPLPRYRITDNLLGDARFCPVVRKTERLREFEDRDLSRRAAGITGNVEPALLARAVWYLYSKETRSTFAIEHEEPGDRMDRFMAQLEGIGRSSLDDEAELVALQNAIVQPPYREDHFRRAGDHEVYVGETIGFKERIHHIGARSAITPELMAGLRNLRQVQGPGGPVVEASCGSFGFVFIHPFGDGNGRIHRLLLHHVLARRHFLPRDLVVPISSVILRDLRAYDEVLEDFSRPRLRLTKYSISDQGELAIQSAPDDAYRYPDLTPQTEATFAWLATALEEDLPKELAFLRNFDEVRQQMRAIVEMPDRKEQLFIKLCLQGRGRLSKAKRALFDELSDDVITRLEGIVADALQPEAGDGSSELFSK